MNKFLHLGSLAAVSLLLSSHQGFSQNLLKDLWPGANDGFPYYMTATDDYMIFRAESPVNGRELWITDGTSNGTKFLKDIYAGSGNSSPYEPFAFNDKVLFSADDNVHGIELWVTDGTSSGTKLLKDIWTGANFTDSRPYGYARIGNKVVFTAQISSFQYEPMVTDGTTAGTVLLKDIYVGTAGSLSDLYSRYVENNGLLYFVAVNAANGQELWKTDGTTTGTRLVKDINAGANYGLRFENEMISFQNELYFIANDGSGTGDELWKTDGTSSGTKLVKDINPGSGNSSVSNFAVAGNKLFFTADNGTLGRELWVTDGKTSGTKLVKDIWPGSGNGFPQYMTELKGKVYFSAEDPTYAREVWVSDGTASGTKVYKDFYYLGDSNPRGFFNYADLLYVSVDIPNTVGRETWIIDGDSANTRILKDIWPGTASSVSSLFTPFNDLLIFQATTPNEGVELWAYNPCSTANIDNTVTTTNDTLVSNASNVAYQWVYCGGNEEIILEGDTTDTFYPQLSGKYRVDLKGEGCLTSSACQTIDRSFTFVRSDFLLGLSDTIPGATYQWFNCDSNKILTAKTTSLIEPGYFGNFAVIISWKGVVDTTQCYAFEPGGIENNSNSLTISAFPNPFKERITIILEKATEKVEYVLTDIQGKELKSLSSTKNLVEIDMQGYPSGVYLLKLQSVGFNRTIKLIKK